MKKFFALMATMLLAASMAFAGQATGGSDKPQDTTKTSTKKSGKSAKSTKTSKAHKGGKKSKKGSSTTTTPTPK